MSSVRPIAAGQHQQALIMEQVILQVRKRWFGARDRSLDCAVSLTETGGELISLVHGERDQVDQLIAGAAIRGAHVVATNFTHPSDLAARLLRQGYRLVQRHGGYVFHPDLLQSASRQERRGLLSILRFRQPLDVSVQMIGEAEMPLWSDVCNRAFGSRLSPEASLREKMRAFQGLGSCGRWYLAFAGDRPVGTVSLFQSDDAAQMLAVGTLPSCRGRGVASAIIRKILEDWQQQGRGFLFLDTSPGSPAERLYLRFGFRQAYIRELYAPGHG